MEKISLYMLSTLVLLLAVFALPVSVLPPISVKVVLLTFMACIPILALAFNFFHKKRFVVPSTNILFIAVLLPVVSFLSYIFSGMQSSSLSDLFFSVDTVVVTTLFSILFIVFSMQTQRNAKKITTLLMRTMFASMVIMGVAVLTQLLSSIGWLPQMLTFNVETLIAGRLQDLSLFAGLVIMLAMTVNLKGIWKYVQYSAVMLAVLTLVLINVSFVWGVIAVISALYSLYMFTSGKKAIRPIVMFAVSLIFVIFGAYISTQISKVIDVNILDVRPSWAGSFEITKAVYKDSLLLGSGPNTFVNEWALHKSQSINTTQFWAADFTQGIGFLPTKFTTTGLLGGVLWVLFLFAIFRLGFSVLWRKDGKSGYTLVLFMAMLYLWILAIFSVPNIVMLSLMFIVSGLFVSEQVRLGRINLISYDLKDASAAGFIAMVVIGVVVLMTSVVMYFVLLEGTTSVMLSRANILFTKGEGVRAAKLVNNAALINDSSIIAGVQTSISFVELRKTLAKKADKKDADIQKEKIRKALSDTLTNALRATKLAPNNYKSWLELANIYSEISSLGIDGSFENAENAFNNAEALNPLSPRIPLAKARMFISKKDLKKAREYIADSIKLKQNYTDAYYVLAQIEVSEGNLKEAIQSVESAVILNPNNSALLFQLGVLQYNIKDYKKAKTVFERAVITNPTYANALYFLGLTYNKLGDNKNALKVFTEVSRLNPGNKDVAKIVSAIKGELSKDDKTKKLELPKVGGKLPVSDKVE